MCSVVCPVRLDEVNGIEHVGLGGTIAYAELRAAFLSPAPRAQVAICAGGFGREAVYIKYMLTYACVTYLGILGL